MLLLLACAVDKADDPDDTATDTVSDADTDTDADGDSDTDADTDVDTDTDPLPDAWGPTTGTLNNRFTVDLDVAGSDRLDQATLIDSSGELVLERATHGAVAYEAQEWTSAGYTLYDVLSVADDGSTLAVSYFYAQRDRVPYVYTESYTLPVDWEGATGSVDGSMGDATADVSLPALRALPPGMDIGVALDGGGLHLDDDGGTLILDGVTRSVHPMALVDCSECPGGPWHEIHVVLAGDDACFGIFYLYPDDPTFTDLEYGICLPTLTRLSGRIESSWTGTPRARREPPPDVPVRGVPPPARR